MKVLKRRESSVHGPLNAYTQCPAKKIRGDITREMYRDDARSISHVTMNPRKISRFHYHRHSTEICIITRGMGLLIRGEQQYALHAGCVYVMPAGAPHLIKNEGRVSLEYLAVFVPPSSENDTERQSKVYPWEGVKIPAPLPRIASRRDGDNITAYAFPKLGHSFAFNWVNVETHGKKLHHHEKAKEWLYCIEGQGILNVKPAGSRTTKAFPKIKSGDLFEIPAGEGHCLTKEGDQSLVVLWISSPGFSSRDVYYK